VGYKNIVLDNERYTIFLAKEGMKIGFGSIGKGYAADKAREFMISKGVKSVIINASGDMNTWGKQPDGKSWTIGVTNPLKKDKLLAVITLTESAIFTSGNYEQFVLLESKRYTHIINPKNGLSCNRYLQCNCFRCECRNGKWFFYKCNGFEKRKRLKPNRTILRAKLYYRYRYRRGCKLKKYEVR